jgi:mono/diheme cytochrome c family protein
MKSALPALLLLAVLTPSLVAAQLAAPPATKTARPAPVPRRVDFVAQVRPLFAASCYSCHGPAAQTAGLRLDRKADAFKGGISGSVLVPGHAEKSRLLRYVAGLEKGKQMPPTGPRLSAAQVNMLRRWVNEGAVWPDDAAALASGPAPVSHWAYRPVVRPALPPVKNVRWVRNPVDRFVLARLEAEKIAPLPEADRRTLIRRVSLDLVGLPPIPSEVDRFVADKSPDAYEKLVERLLASPHYGERWARVWLDGARYADTNGYEKDNPRVMWKWRDGVIGALNRDLPYDQFVIEQLAGDLLPGATLDQKVATGFHRNTLTNEEGGVDAEQFRWEAVHDRVATTGSVLLGQTFACARCHDHKYDPITQRDYYRFAAFFNNADEPQIDAAAPDVIARRDAVRAEIATLERQMKSDDDLLRNRWREIEASLTGEQRAKLPADVQTTLALPDDKRTDAQRTSLTDAYRNTLDEKHPVYVKKIATLKATEPAVPTALVMAERNEARVTRIFARGEFLQPGAVVTAGVPGVLPPLPPGAKPDRLTLARWIVSPKNPLAARVAVNRAWQALWGRGIVATSDDFGTRGEKPSHRALLDWLAAEFMAPSVRKSEKPWSMKALHRLLVTSAAYRQSARVTPVMVKRDQANVLLARGPRFRVDAEMTRDIALAASGLLNPAVGGPSVFPPQPDGVTGLSYGPLAWATETGPNRYRRALYTFLKRTAPYPALTLFDAPSGEIACTRRNRSNTPLQALVTLNDTVFIEAARALARRLAREPGADTGRRVRIGFRHCVGRSPDAVEQARVETLFTQQLAKFQAEPARAKQVIGVVGEEKTGDVPVLAAWTVVARVLLNLDETFTKE